MQNHLAQIAMSGRFDFDVHRDFRDAYMPLINNAAVREIEIELSKVDYLDSAALGMLMLLNERAREANKRITLINASSAVSRVLGIANFSSIFNIRNAR